MITDYAVKALIGQGLRSKSTPMSDAIDRLAVVVPSLLPAGSKEDLSFLGAIPAFRKWIGTREAKKVLQQLFSAALEKYENTVDIPLDWINNDKSNQVAEIAGGLATSKRRWKTRLLFDLLNAAGGTTLGSAFDTKAFYATDHVWGKSTYDNTLAPVAATGTSPTANESADAIVAAIQRLYSFNDDQGEPINEDISELTLITGTTIGAFLLQGAKEQRIDTGAGVRDNPVMGMLGANNVKLNVIISPRYTVSAAFDLINTSAGACPLLFIENSGDGKPTSMAAGSDYEHTNDAWQYGLKAVGVAAFGRFTDAVRSTFT
jgi:hypothetical protein